MPLRVAPLQIEPLLRHLAEHRVEFVIIGGFSLSVHGVVRGTKDIDIVPNPEARNLARLADALAAIEAEILLADDFDPGELGIEPNAEGLAFGGNWVLRTTLGRLDVMQEVAGVRGFPQLDANAVEVEVPGAGTFRFAGYEDLIAMKTAAGRPQDEIDIVSLQRARGG
jgi:predicted nucleotidyltransferase